MDIIFAIIIYLEITTITSAWWVIHTKLFYSENYITPRAMRRVYGISKFVAILLYVAWFVAAPVFCIINILEWYFTNKRKD